MVTPKRVHTTTVSDLLAKSLANGGPEPSGHETGRVQDPAWPAGLWWSPPPESNRRPHPYHRWSARSGDNAAPRSALQNRKWPAVSRIEKWGAARRYAARLLANRWHAVGSEQAGSDLQDSRGSSTAYWPVVSLQLRSDRSSSQCAPVGPSSARWNDIENDKRALWRRFLWAGTCTAHCGGRGAIPHAGGSG